MWGYPEYKPVKEMVEDNEKKLKKYLKKNPHWSPIKTDGKKMAYTWWALAWNKNLENYADYSNRIGRGRSYLKNSAVFDLQIEPALVTAIVQGSDRDPYDVTVNVKPLSEEKWQFITALCSHQISSIEALSQGQFPEELAKIFTDPENGLFPTAKELEFNCSCYDWASMCKHVSAALYGIGAKFDSDPTLLFKLRNINFEVLLKKSIAEKMQNMLKNANKASQRKINKDVDIKALFDI